MSNGYAQQQFREWYDQLQATGGLGDPISVATDRTSQFSMLRMAWTAAWEARGAVAQEKTDALRRAYSPEGSAEVAAEPFRARVPHSDLTQYRTGRFRPELPLYPGPLPALGEQSPGWREGPPPVTRIDDYTRVDIPAFPIQFQGTSEPGQPPSELFGPGQEDQRYAPTTTMAALPDDTNPGFRVPPQFGAVQTVWDGHQADRG